VLVLVAAGLAAGAALGTQPAWRIADGHRALEIGLTGQDLGPGWQDNIAKGSPEKIDFGVVSQSLTAECSGPVPATKASIDLDLTGASESSFIGQNVLVSLVMLFKTGTMARMQMPVGGDIKGLGPCIASELGKGMGAGSNVTVLGSERLHVATGAERSLAMRIRARTKLGGLSRILVIDLVLQQGGRGLVETVLLGVGSAPSTALESRLAHLSARRLSTYAA
jgi:hypothetical protein